MCRPVVRLALLVVVATALSIPSASVAATTRWHADWRTTPKLILDPDFQARGTSDVRSIARMYVEHNRNLFQLPSSPADLKLENERQSLLAWHFRFQQYLDGVPVKDAEIIVSVSRAGEVLRVYNNTYPVQQAPLTQGAAMGPERALDIAWNHLRVHGEILGAEPTARLVYRPESDRFRLVYLTQVNVTEPWGRWEHQIDATTGEVVGLRRTEISRRPHEPEKWDFESYGGEIADRARAVAEFRAKEEETARTTPLSKAVVNGEGTVFDPDPRTTLGDASLEDDSPAGDFSGSYVTRDLLGITESGGTYSLVGPFVEISDFESPTAAPSTNSTGIWSALRGDNAFNDAVTYFHIDQNQRYVQALGFTGATGIQEGPIEVDTNGLGGADNSYYLPGTNQLAFGHGGVDDNEDADVILHEYMHALTHDINSSWGGGDSGAIGEGLGDYWGGSYSYSTPNGPSFNPSWAFSWDGHSLSSWRGRFMDLDPASAQYDSSCTYQAHTSCGGVNGDELWSTPIFQAFLDLVGGQSVPRTEVDTIILESQFGLGAGVDMPTMAETIVSTAQSLYPAGPHEAAFKDQFVAHGILVLPSLPNPTLSYPAGGETLEAGSVVNVAWTAIGAPSSTTYTLYFSAECSPQVVFADDMEAAVGWTASHDQSYGNFDWSLSTDSPHGGSSAWFAPDPGSTADQYLSLDSAVTIGGIAALSFWHDFFLESGWDGGVVEISTDGGATWKDLGPFMTANGYTGSVSGYYGNPLGDAPAFTGNSEGYQKTEVDLSSFAGSDVRLRFRLASDSMYGQDGWSVDDLEISSSGAWIMGPTSAPGAETMSWTVPLAEGDDFCVQLRAEAPDYRDSQTTGGTFSVGFSTPGYIFADGFDLGDCGRWSAVVQ